MNRITIKAASAALACSLLAACGGGGGANSSSTTIPVSKNPAAATATFVVKVPAKPSVTTGGRRAHYITSNVAGIDFTAFNTSNPNVTDYVFYALTPSSSYCTSGASGLTCTLQVGAPPGADTFTVNLYDNALPGQGYVVATGSLQANITAQAANTINVTTNGVPTFAILGTTNPYPATGTSASIPLSLQVTDPDGNIIVGSFDMPLSLSDSDTSGATSLSKTSLSQTSDAAGLTLNYTGSGSAAATVNVNSLSPSYASRNNNPLLASVTVSPGGVGPAVSPAILTFAHANSPAQTITVTGSNGSTGPFTVNAAGCTVSYPTSQTFVTVSGTSPTFSVTPSTTTFNTTASAYYSYGYCQLTVTDSANHSTYVNVMVGQ